MSLGLDEIADKYFNHSPLVLPEGAPQPAGEWGRMASNFTNFDSMLWEGEADIAWDILFEIAMQRGAIAQFWIDMAEYAGHVLKDDNRRQFAEIYAKIHFRSVSQEGSDERH